MLVVKCVDIFIGPRHARQCARQTGNVYVLMSGRWLISVAFALCIFSMLNLHVWVAIEQSIVVSWLSKVDYRDKLVRLLGQYVAIRVQKQTPCMHRSREHPLIFLFLFKGNMSRARRWLVIRTKRSSMGIGRMNVRGAGGSNTSLNWSVIN
jgi:hypothetical protein